MVISWFDLIGGVTCFRGWEIEGDAFVPSVTEDRCGDWPEPILNSV